MALTSRSELDPFMGLGFEHWKGNTFSMVELRSEHSLMHRDVLRVQNARCVSARATSRTHEAYPVEHLLRAASADGRWRRRAYDGFLLGCAKIRASKAQSPWFRLRLLLQPLVMEEVLARLQHVQAPKAWRQFHVQACC